MRVGSKRYMGMLTMLFMLSLCALMTVSLSLNTHSSLFSTSLQSNTSPAGIEMVPLQQQQQQNQDQEEEDQSPPEEEEEPTCPICFEPLSQPSPNGDIRTYTSPCHHTFHQSCINGWTATNTNTCPSCRQPSLPPPTTGLPALMELIRLNDHHTILGNIPSYQEIDMNTPLPNPRGTPYGTERWTPLTLSASLGLLEITTLFLTQLPDIQVNARDGHGNSPFMQAALSGSLPCLRLLTEHGARSQPQKH